MSNSSADDSQARLLAAVFCPSCGVTFTPIVEDHSCPKCQWIAEGTESVSTHLHSSKQAGLRASADSSVDELIGQRLANYDIEALLGAGAMGRVYMARHVQLQRPCALKVLPPKLAESDPDFVRMFEYEGQSAASLVHPNIVTVHAIGQERGYHFLEMEFVAGQSLGALLKREGPQSPLRSTALTLRIAEGLAEAHRKGILHRDLKPENVLLSHHDVPKITDFGLARRVQQVDGAHTMHKVGGTLGFIPPEVLQGAPPTPSADVYALGKLYQCLLTALPAVEANTKNEAIRATIEGERPSVRSIRPDLPLEMAECLAQLTSLSPAERPASGVEAAELLRSVLGQQEDLGALVEKAFSRHTGIRWSRRGESFEIVIELPEGRRQTAWLEPSDHAAADRLVLISSVCGPARPEFYETALRLNSEILHGGIAVRQHEGVLSFVLLDNYPRSTVDAEEIRRSVLEIAQHADSLELLLTGGDRY